MSNAEYGYIVRVSHEHGDSWLGQRIYMEYVAALTVKHNLRDIKRYARVYVVPATKAQFTDGRFFSE
jgi:uncharacterized protein (DUF1786 family)